MRCVCNNSGHRLRTWIPILILIQCGLICLYIAIIQDKSRTQSQSYSPSQGKEKKSLRQQQGIYESPLHVRVAFGNTHYDNEGERNPGRLPDKASGHDGDLPASSQKWESFGTGNGKAKNQGDLFAGKKRNYLTRFNATLQNNTQGEIALQVGNVVRFRSSFTVEGKLSEDKKKVQGMNNEGRLSVGIQPFESISSSGKALEQGRQGPHLMAEQSPAASATEHHSQFNEAAVTPNYNSASKKSAFTSPRQMRGSNDSNDQGAKSTKRSFRAPDTNKDALSGAAKKGQTILHFSKIGIDQGGEEKNESAGDRWRHPQSGPGHVEAGPYSDGQPHIHTKLPSFPRAPSVQNTANSLHSAPNRNSSADEQRGESQHWSVIAHHPHSSDSSPLSTTKLDMAHKGPLHNSTVWAGNNAATAQYSSTAKTLYGIHTPSRRYKSTVNNSSHGTNLFHAYNPLLPPVFHLSEDNATYFSHHGRSLECMNEGTENVFLQGKQEACICKPAWHGEHCSVPDTAMYTSALRYINALTVAKKPRRLINAINFNVEWELLEARLQELDDLVDVFMLVESNYTMYGDAKPLRLLDRMRQGYLQAFHHKITYLFVHSFPEGGRENGWIVDQFARMHIGKEGLNQIEGIRPDDVFIYTDADEIPSRDVLLFLKLHYGYPEPFGLALRWSVFGFFWKQYDLTRIMVGCSIRMLRLVFQSDVYKLRTGTFQMQLEENKGTREFAKDGGIMFEWYFGDGGAHAGWHCSWCMSPDRIRIKLTSAINADFPRWGDYPEKRDLTYIRNLIKTGTWFDDKMTFNSLVDVDSDPNIAPAYMLANFEKYKHLLNLNFAG